MRKITLIAMILVGMLSPVMAQVKDLQFWRPNDQRGVNVFESTKQDTVAYEGLVVRVGGANTLQFQAIEASNSGDVEIFDIGPNFNLATSNLDLDVQLYPGLRMHLRTYLSSRHHAQPYVKGGYMQVDRLDFIQPGFMSSLMDYVTIKVGHMQINYGDNHFRRTDNGMALFNPFVGNYILDAFTTEVGAEVYYKRNGFLGMLGMTNGKLNQSVVKPAEDAPKTKPSLVAKLGFDDQINPDLRFRITGSLYHTPESARTFLYGGDRAGARYYNVLTSNAAEFRIPRYDPGFINELTAIMINTFVKFQGVEFYGVYENVSGKAAAETDRRSFNQIGTELLYRFGAQEKFYLGTRYNMVSGKIQSGDEVDISRLNFGGGWFLTRNVMAKAEYVTQSYSGFPQASVFDQGKFNGIVLEAIISF
ncbi:MAG: hypothetical protein ACK4VN_09000 [Bacteroidales bacterium]